MLFSSLEFLYLFLPLTIIFYFISPSVIKNHILLLASLIFYGLSEPRYLPLMAIISLFNYASGLAIWKAMERERKKVADTLLLFTVAANMLTLFLFKYLNPIISVLGITPLGIQLPVGISFYTFQATSYVFDIRRRAARLQKNPLTFITYVSLFPQLVAGPIVRYNDVDESLEKREHSAVLAAQGVRLFLVGLSKKVLLANPAGECFERLTIFSKNNGTVLGAWLGLVFFSFQIYFDFSGYSDMAVGLGKIFGFDFPENFRYPYISKSITEFWRRWHITLSSWFKEYVYIPLGGNKRGKGRTYLHLFITWTLTGIWHGSSFNFLLWGLYFFVILVIEKAFLLRQLQKAHPFIQHGYSLLLILIGWFIFTMDSLEPLQYAKQLAGISVPFLSNDSLFELLRNLPFLFILALGSTPLPKRFVLMAKRKFSIFSNIAIDTLGVASLLVCTAFIVSSGYNPFLYFRF